MRYSPTSVQQSMQRSCIAAAAKFASHSMLYRATDTVFCFTVLWYAAHYLCRALLLREFALRLKCCARSYYCTSRLCLARNRGRSERILHLFLSFFYVSFFPCLTSLTALVGHHRHGRSRSVALGIEHLQGNEILREGLQIVDTVILKHEDEGYTFVSLFAF